MPHEPAVWSPMRDLMDIEDTFERFFPFRKRLRRMLSEWAPPVDMYEHDHTLYVRAEMPGLSKEDIHITVEGDMLTIRGERKKEEEIKEDAFFRSERVYGMFSRSISLPLSVDRDNMKAVYRDGVLTVEMPVSREARKKELQVQVQ